MACGIGEIPGFVIATALGWSNVASIALAVALIFPFGYALALWPLLRAGLTVLSALALVAAAETVAITIMEIVDNAIVVAIPGALDAELSDFLFWWSLGLGLAVAWIVVFPVNRWLIARARGTHSRIRAWRTTSERARRMKTSPAGPSMNHFIP